MVVVVVEVVMMGSLVLVVVELEVGKGHHQLRRLPAPPPS